MFGNAICINNSNYLPNILLERLVIYYKKSFSETNHQVQQTCDNILKAYKL